MRHAGAFPGFFPSCEVTVVGNIDASGASGNPPGSYIAALILPISQEIANGGVGFITAIDYAKGRFEVNGKLNTLGTGTIVEINDPVGRYGLAHSPDPRFTADTDNPTVTSGNGYPMGIPTVAPPAIDPDRPLYNRPLNPAPGVTAPFRHDPLLQVGAPLTSFAMPAAAAPNAPGVTTPDPWKQVPFMVGDFVAYSGNLYKIDPSAPVTPFNPAAPIGPNNRPMNQQFYVSATTRRGREGRGHHGPRHRRRRPGARLHDGVPEPDRDRRGQPDRAGKPRTRHRRRRDPDRRAAARYLGPRMGHRCDSSSWTSSPSTSIRRAAPRPRAYWAASCRRPDSSPVAATVAASASRWAPETSCR